MNDLSASPPLVEYSKFHGRELGHLSWSVQQPQHGAQQDFCRHVQCLLSESISVNEWAISAPLPTPSCRLPSFPSKHTPVAFGTNWAVMSGVIH